MAHTLYCSGTPGRATRSLDGSAHNVPPNLRRGRERSDGALQGSPSDSARSGQRRRAVPWRLSRRRRPRCGGHSLWRRPYLGPLKDQVVVSSLNRMGRPPHLIKLKLPGMVDTQSAPALSALAPKLRRLFALSAAKIRSIEQSWAPANGAPVFTVGGKYTSRGWTEWTQGFQFGSAILQFDATGDAEFLEIGRQRTVDLMAPHSSLSTGVSSIFDARLNTCARTFSAAFFTAPPEMMVVLEAYAPTSNGVVSVSPEVITILSSVTPRLSAAICDSTVSAPPPTSEAPTCKKNAPSSFIFRNADAQSTPAIPLPCMQHDIPTPRFKCPRNAGARRFFSHPIASAPCRMHSGNPQLRMTRGNPSRPSPSCAESRSISPSRMAFFK